MKAWDIILIITTYTYLGYGYAITLLLLYVMFDIFLLIEENKKRKHFLKYKNRGLK